MLPPLPDEPVRNDTVAPVEWVDDVVPFCARVSPENAVLVKLVYEMTSLSMYKVPIVGNPTVLVTEILDAPVLTFEVSDVVTPIDIGFHFFTVSFE
jgi:hypothetical protein